MTRYEDDVVTLSDDSVTIKSYLRPGSFRSIPYADIRSAELIELRFGTGRYRLVGLSPGRLRTFFHWDRSRRRKSHGIRLDTGGFLKPAITPEDTDLVLALLEDEIGSGGSSR